MKIQPAINFSHQLLKKIIQPGNTVIDGTVGNGHDTLFLSELVGTKGHVYGFDVQAQALANAKKRLIENHAADNVSLIHSGHQLIDQFINKPINGAIFNLGYLPGGDHNITTHGATTISAIKQCLNLLQSNGVIALVLYYGHPGGQEEKTQVLQFTTHLNQKNYSVLQYGFINQINNPPILLAIQKR